MTAKLCACGCGEPAPIAGRNNPRFGHVKGLPTRFISGHNKGRLRHGATRTPEYAIYKAAKTRCTSTHCKDWPNYGGRGIRFLFTSFEQFLTALGPRPAGTTLDRIDNDRHYALGNVRWATRREQRLNQRKQPDA